MRVFVTGASGWIGSAVVPELIDAGHQVIGLARSDDSAAALTAVGAEALRGTIDDLDRLRSAAAASDGVIHLAFKHDIAFSGGFEAAADADRRAVETFGGALAGSGRPFLIASGTAGLVPGRVATERDGLDPGSAAHPGSGPEIRRATAHLTLSLASRGVRSSVVRLPPTVHGEGDHGFMATLVGVARDRGVSGYIGEVIGRHLGLPVAAISPADAAGHFGWLGAFLALDTAASSALTRELLGWQPVQPGLLDD